MTDSDQPTRSRLLDATRRCVARDGLRATTSRAITAEAGANLAAITYHFGSKDALVAEALAEEVHAWLDPAVDALRSEGEPVVRMLGAAAALVQTFGDVRDRIPIVLEALVQTAHPPAPAGTVVALWRQVRALLRHQIAELRGAGEVPDWVDPDAMAATIMSVAVGAAMAAVVDPDGPDPAMIAAEVTGLFAAVYRPSDPSASGDARVSS